LEKDLQITDEALLDSLQLTEGSYLRRAALLLFHQDPEKWVPGAFFRSGMIESWGRGIEKITEACQNAGKPAPVIEYKHNREFSVMFYSDVL
jgi:predicted HTH transcriptional regulator